MEDILASIRKIVSQDSADTARAEARPGAASAVDRRAPSPDASGASSSGSGDSFSSFAKAIAGGESAAESRQVAPPSAPRWAAPRPPESAARSAEMREAPKPSGQAGSLAGVLQSVRQSWPQNEPVRRERIDGGAEPPPAARAAIAPKVEAKRADLVSPSAEAAVTGSLERLKKSVAENLDARTEAMLRPMLREWLDEHLPKIVERLVAVEIERIARKS